LIRYADHVLEVPYTPALEAELHTLLAGMRQDREADSVGRSHAVVARCRACGLRPVCDERLI
jgi:CRISPR/Cas system-associated exonuclease Cas4 (RecB family)